MTRPDRTSILRDLFFPPRCATCGELLPPLTDEVFCSECRPLWDAARLVAAERAARSAVSGHAYLVGYRSGKTDGVPERFVFHLKHKGDPRAFSFAAKALSVSVRAAVSEKESKIDAPGNASTCLFTYPPRRRAGIREDGFDQAARLAKAVAREMEGDCSSIFRRTRTGKIEQKTLDAAGRETNAAHAYVLRKSAASLVKGRTVVLCDDLCTTGATLSFCTELLYNAGARCVVWATVGQTDAGMQLQQQ